MNTDIMSRAMLDVMAERARQVTVLGYTPEHDDAHIEGELTDAAAAYALNAYKHYGSGTFTFANQMIWEAWGVQWFKPKGLRGDLVRAAALIIADIERIDRIETRAGAQP